INSTIPLGTATGSGYKVRVVSSNASQTSNASAAFSIVSPAHVTMSLTNVSQPTPKTLEFDLMVVSDGNALSDLRANAFQYGLDYNSGILAPSATITPSYIGGNDFTSLNGF